jgi:hypothetical protein
MKHLARLDDDDDDDEAASLFTPVIQSVPQNDNKIIPDTY